MRNLGRELLESDITVPLIKANKTSGGSFSYHGDVGFDSNMVVILAALLCALICALGLSAIVRCARRCTRSSSSAAVRGAAFPLDESAAGVKKEELGWIPVVVYGAGKRIPATECPICLGEFAQGEDVRILPKCNHGFHVKCIDTWLVLHSSCPTCRHPLIRCSPPETTVTVGITRLS